MENRQVLSHVDHTLLRATVSWEEIQQLCREAIQYHIYSVCIPPCYAKRVRSEYSDRIRICVVVGFPLGYSVTAAKLTEVATAISEGADEIDMVVNLCDVKNGDFEKVQNEIATLKQACGNKILKVIVETCYLTQEEKIALCHCVSDGGADFIKTSTGFGTAGATIEDIRLFQQHINSNVKIKAAGGIKCRADMENFIESGCERLGTSSAIRILTNKAVADY